MSKMNLSPIEEPENGDLSSQIVKEEEIKELSSNVSMDMPQRPTSASPPRPPVIKPRTSSLREKTPEVF
jgi:hypothetical protein